jgi:chromosome segregation ATPase
VCANRVVGKFTDLVSKNLGWGDAPGAESKTKPVLPLTFVLQAVDTQLDSFCGDDGDAAERRADDPALRERCAKIVSKISGVAALSSELARLFEQYEAIAEEFETTRFAVHETRGRLAEESDAHAALQNRFAALERGLVLEKSETAALRAELEHWAAREADLELRLHAMQADLHRAREIIQDGELQSEARAAEIASLRQNLQTAKQEVLKAEITAATLRAELSSALAHASNVEAANSALQVALSDSRDGLEHLAESLDEARQELQRSQARVHELEQENESQVGAHRQVSDGMLSQVVDQRAEMAALDIQLAVFSARLEAADRLLKDVPALMERAATWEQKVAVLEAENAEMRAQAAEFEELQQAVAERAHALVDAIKAKDKESSQTKASLATLSTHLESETKRFEVDRARLENVIADLKQELAAERSRPEAGSPADTIMADSASAEPQGDREMAKHQEPIIDGDGGSRIEPRPPSPKLALEEHPKPNSGGGRKRRPRHRESNRHISRH